MVGRAVLVVKLTIGLQPHGDSSRSSGRPHRGVIRPPPAARLIRARARIRPARGQQYGRASMTPTTENCRPSARYRATVRAGGPSGVPCLPCFDLAAPAHQTAYPVILRAPLAARSDMANNEAQGQSPGKGALRT